MKHFIPIVLLTSASLSWARITPIEPELVMSDGEISTVLGEKNLFFFRDAYENPTWDRTKRQYGSHLLGTRDEFYSMKDVIERVLGQGIPVRHKIEELYRSGMGRHTSWGAVFPSVSIKFGDGISPNVHNLFRNLFGFVLPQTWLNLVNSYKAYDASRLLFMKMALDEYYRAENLFIAVHKGIQDFEIRNFYMVHALLLKRLFPQSERHINTMLAFTGDVATEMALNRGELKLLFDELAYTMALKMDEHGNLGATRVNIRNLEEFPTIVRQLEDLEERYANKETFLSKVVERSVELRIVAVLNEIAKLNIGIAATGSTLATIETPGIYDPRFAVNLGYGTLPTILTSTSSYRSSKIKVDEEYLNLLNTGRRAHDLYTNSLGLFVESTRSLAFNRQAFKDNLRHVLDEGGEIDGLFVSSFSKLVDAELKMNRALHSALQSMALMKRLMVTEEEGIVAYLPSNDVVIKALKKFKETYSDTMSDSSFVDGVVRDIRHTSKLDKFLSGNLQAYGRGTSLSETEVRTAIERNIPHLLHRQWNFGKSDRFFRHLGRYVKSKGIVLNQYEQAKLEDLSKPFWKRWFDYSATR